MDKEMKYAFKNICFFLIEENLNFKYEPLRHLIWISDNFFDIHDLNKLNKFIEDFNSKKMSFHIEYNKNELCICGVIE